MELLKKNVIVLLSLFLSACFSDSRVEQSTAVFKKIKVKVEEVSLYEGETKVFLVELATPTVEPMILKWSIEGDYASQRFQFTTGTVSIPKNSDSAPIQLISTEDSDFNPDITYEIKLESLTDLRQKIDLRSTTFSLVDNDPKPELSFSSTSNTAVESDGSVPIYVSLNRLSGKDIVVNLQMDTSATTDTSDLTYSSSFTVPKGVSSFFTNINILDDTEVEGSENLVLNIVSAKYENIEIDISSTDRQHDLRIDDNESTTINDPSSLVMVEPSANSGYARTQNINIDVTEDIVTHMWCISELQTTRPANGSYPGVPPATCLGGTGSQNGWHVRGVDGEPSSFTLTSGDGLKTVYAWTANVFNIVADNPATATITLDTTAPTITVSKASGQADPASSLSVLFSAQFSEQVVSSSLANDEVEFGGSAFAPAGSISTSDDTLFSVSVNDVNSNGSISVSIPSAVTTDLAGNPNLASVDGVDNSVALNIAQGKAIYRSVGFGSTSALASNSDGSGVSLQFYESKARFSSPLSLNVGLGDALVFDSDNNGSLDSVYFIRGRITQKLFNIRNSQGNESSLSSSTINRWEIYRSYTSLRDAENGVINTSIPVPFDTWSGGRDLVANNETWNLVLYADAPETISSPIEFSGWTTSGFNRLKLFTANSASHSANRSRHLGVWDSSKYSLVSTGKIFSIAIDYMNMYGLQLQGDASLSIEDFITIDVPGDNGGLEFYSNILRSSSDPSLSSSSFLKIADTDSLLNVKVANNIFILDNQLRALSVDNSDGTFVVYHNTFINNGILVSGDAPNLLLKNNIFQAPIEIELLGSASLDSGSDYNVFSGSTSSGGSNDIVSQNLSFFDSVGFNYRLSLTDARTLSTASNLSSDSKLVVTKDAVGTERRAYDFGALAANLTSHLWLGEAADDNWSSSANWNAGSVPINDSRVYFNYLSGTGNVVIDNPGSGRPNELVTDFDYAGTIRQVAGVSFRTLNLTMRAGSFIGSDSQILINEKMTLGPLSNFTSTSGSLKFNAAECCRTVRHDIDTANFNANSGTLLVESVETGSANWSTSFSNEFLVRQNTTFGDFTVDIRDATGDSVKNWEYMRFAEGSLVRVGGDLTIRDGNILTEDFYVDGNVNLLCDDPGTQDCAEIPTSPGRYGSYAVAGMIFDSGASHTITVTQGAATGGIKILNNSTVSLAGTGLTETSFSSLELLDGTFNNIGSTNLKLKSEINSITRSENKTNLLTVSSGTNFNLNSAKLILNPRTHRANSNLTPERSYVNVHSGVSFDDLEIIVDTQGKDIVKTILANRGADLNVNGNLNVIGDGRVESNFNLSGNINLPSGLERFTGDVTFVGTTDQSYDNGSGADINGDIIVNKASGNLSLLTPVNLNAAGEDFTIAQGQVLMGGSLNVSGTLSLATGTGLYTYCNAYTQGTLVNNGTIHGGVATPNASISDVIINEGETASFTVSLDNFSCGGDITLNYATQNLTALTQDNDYASTSGLLTFTPGSMSMTVDVSTTDDSLWEEDESFTIELSTPTGTVITDASGTATITDNDNLGTNHVWTGLGSTDNWSEAANWANNLIPGTNDDAYFPSTCTNCNVTIDSTIELRSLSLMTGYTGTVTQASGSVVTLGGEGLRIYSGSFAGGDSGINVNGLFHHRAGSFSNTSDVLFIRNHVISTSTAADFTGGTTRVRGAFVMDMAANEFSTLRVESTSGSISINGSVYVNGDLELAHDNVINRYLQGEDVYVRGNLNAIQGSSGGTATIHMVGTSPQALTVTDGALPNLTINSTSTLSLTGLIPIRGDFVYLAGTTNTTGSTVRFFQSITPGAMTFDNVEVTDSSNRDVLIVGTLDVDGDLRLLHDNTVNRYLNGGSLTLAGNLLVEEGSSGGSANIVLDGSGLQTVSTISGEIPNLTISSSGTVQFLDTAYFSRNFTYTSGTVVTTGSTFRFKRQITPGTIEFNNVIFRDSFNYESQIIGNLDVAGKLTIDHDNSANRYLNGGSISLSGDLELIQGSYAGTTTLTLDGSGTQTITATNGEMLDTTIASTGSVIFNANPVFRHGFTYVSGNVDISSVVPVFKNSIVPGNLEFGDVTLRDASNTSLNITGTMDINGDLIINHDADSGRYANGGSISLAGNLTATRGSAGGSTAILLDGTSDQIITQTAGRLPGAELTVNKASGVVLLASNSNLNGSGQDLNIIAGDLRLANYNLSIIDNLNIEAGNTIYEDCGTLSYGSITGAGSVISGGGSPVVSIDDAVVTEGEPAQLTISLDRAYCSGNFSANYTLVDGTATSIDDDYNSFNGSGRIADSGTLSFSQGQLTRSLTIPTTNDSFLEADEDFSVVLSNLTTGSFSKSTATVTVSNDDSSTFIWTGASGNGLWSNSANWAGAAVPGTTDVAFFDDSCAGANCDVTIDSSIDVLGIRVASSYTGTITQASGSEIITRDGDFLLEGGSFVGSDARVRVMGHLKIANSSFQSTSDTLEIGQARTSETVEGLELSASTSFVHNSGTINFNGQTSAGCEDHQGNRIRLDQDIDAFNFTISHRDTNAYGCSSSNRYNDGYISLSGVGRINVYGFFRFDDGYLRNGTINLYGDAGFYCAGGHYNDSDSCSAGSGATVRFVGTADQSVDVEAGVLLPKIEVASGNTVDFTPGATNISVKHLAVSSGTLNMPNDGVRFAGSTSFPNAPPSIDITAGSNLNLGNKLVINTSYRRGCGGAQPGFILNSDQDFAVDLFELRIVDTGYNCGSSGRNRPYFNSTGTGVLTVNNQLNLFNGRLVNANIRLLGDMFIRCNGSNPTDDDDCFGGGSNSELELAGTGVQRLSMDPNAVFGFNTVMQNNTDSVVLDTNLQLNNASLDINSGDIDLNFFDLTGINTIDNMTGTITRQAAELVEYTSCLGAPSPAPAPCP